MIYIGSHVGFKKDTQLVGSVEETMGYGANTFMFYTGAPQNTVRSQIDDFKTIEAMKFAIPILLRRNTKNLLTKWKQFSNAH